MKPLKMLMLTQENEMRRRRGRYAEGGESAEMRRYEDDTERRMGGYRYEDDDMPEMRRRRDRRGRYMMEDDEMRMGDYPESRFRDRRGREHYDNGRYAPMRNQRTDFNNERGGEGNEYEYEFGDVEANFRPYLLPKRTMGFSSDGIDGKQQHYSRGRASSEEGLDERTAHEWSKKMKNADGSTGAHWTKEQVKPYMNQVGYQGDEIEFWIIMNAMYSDYCKVAKKYGVDRPEYYAEIAKAWLDDKDAVPDKAAAYYECIVKH